MRGRIGLAAAGLAAVLVAASATHAAETLVRPGKGIGGVSIGMSLAQVKRALGKPTLVNERIALGFGNEYLEYDWGHGRWTVGLQGRPGALRVVKVATTLNRQRSRQGLGSGSRIRDILRVYPYATCSSWAGLGTNSSMGTWVTIHHPNGARTIFVVYHEGVPNPPPGRVVEVRVQQPAAGLAERRDGCGPDWRRR
jgi:hypothetical protein